MNRGLVKALNERQKALGLTRYRIGKLSGLTQKSVDRVMDGETDPHVGILEKLALALGLKVAIVESPKE